MHWRGRAALEGGRGLILAAKQQQQQKEPDGRRGEDGLLHDHL